VIKLSVSKEIWKKSFSLAARVIVSAIVLYFVVSLVQWENVLLAYKAADSRYIIIAVMLLSANLGIRTFKWRSMLCSIKDAPTLSEAFGSVMLGISLGSFTPGEIGDYAGRALHITDAKRSHLVGLTLLDKAQIFVITSASGLISLAFLTIDNSLYTISVTIIIILLSIVILMRLGLIADFGHHLNASFFQKHWLTKILDGFTLLQPRQLLITILYTMIFHIVLVLQMYFLINAFSGITLSHAFIGTSAMMFVKSLLPISLGDLGIREASSIFFFSSFGISQAAALNASLLLFVINVFIPSAAGAYFLKHQQLENVSFFKFMKKK